MAEDDDVPLTGEIRQKLVDAKQAWARDGRLLTGTHGDPVRDRLPPGQTLVQDWPVLDLGVQPDVAPETWRLRLEGLVEAPLRLTLDDFMALPQTELVNDIHCVTQWSRYDNHWQGVQAPSCWPGPAEGRRPLRLLHQLRRLHHQCPAGGVRRRRGAAGP